MGTSELKRLVGRKSRIPCLNHHVALERRRPGSALQQGALQDWRVVSVERQDCRIRTSDLRRRTLHRITCSGSRQDKRDKTRKTTKAGPKAPQPCSVRSSPCLQATPPNDHRRRPWLSPTAGQLLPDQADAALGPGPGGVSNTTFGPEIIAQLPPKTTKLIKPLCASYCFPWVPRSPGNLVLELPGRRWRPRSSRRRS